jgi:hypothetical protein
MKDRDAASSCASQSCPPFATFDGKHIDEQLDAASRSFINGGAVARDGNSASLRVSPIFRWYRRDFGGEDGVRDFISRYVEPGSARDVLDKSSRLRYQPYNWSLNAA